MMDHLLMAGCLQSLGLVAALAFFVGLLSGAKVRKRRDRSRVSDKWLEWQRDPRTRRD